jgi:hypothetical protein
MGSETPDEMRARLGIGPGDIYERCDYHPCLCVAIDYEGDSILGISLLDESLSPLSSLSSCGVRKMTLEEMWRIKQESLKESR